ncbi:hypothetical protein R80B4_02156 [Fibrobacteres bacterium R8-0-B4]
MCSLLVDTLMGAGVRMPATTSSPWALTKYSPKNFFSPLAGLRVKATPVAEESPMLPKTMAWTLVAVPHSWGMPSMLR